MPYAFYNSSDKEQPTRTEEYVKRLLSTKEIAKAFGLTDQTLRQWRMKGEGPPYYRVGDGERNRVRYDAEKVKAWLTDREQ
ncbi:helix-turn-helix transcriptional regulator [Actinomycetota bacterium]